MRLPFEYEEEIAELKARLREIKPYLKEGETPLECIIRNRKDMERAMQSEAHILRLYEEYLKQKAEESNHV